MRTNQQINLHDAQSTTNPKETNILILYNIIKEDGRHWINKPPTIRYKSTLSKSKDHINFIILKDDG